MNPFFSIIVPVYNVEGYLYDCLDSVINQDFNSWELICVNDGSTDNSADILSEFKALNDNIIIKNIENSGTSVARNVGIGIAKGKYVLFLDSDDWLEENSLHTIHQALQDFDTDIISFNGQVYYENNGITKEDPGYSIKPIAGWAYYNEQVLRTRSFHFVSVVLRAYKRTFLIENRLLFTPGILHEDNLFSPIAFYYANSVAEIPDILYTYRIREGSKMSEYDVKQIKDKCEVNNRLGDFFFSIVNVNTRLDIISRIIASDYISLFGSRVNNVIRNNQTDIISSINKDHFKQSCINFRHKFLYRLIRIHPAIFRIYIKVVSKFHSCFL